MTIQSSGILGLTALNSEFGLGNNLAAYRGVQWWTDAGATGTFSSPNISLSEAYGKRRDNPFNVSIALPFTEQGSSQPGWQGGASLGAFGALVAAICIGPALGSTGLSVRFAGGKMVNSLTVSIDGVCGPVSYTWNGTSWVTFQLLNLTYGNYTLRFIGT